MKYKDKKFTNFQEKQRNGDLEYYSNRTERQIRREIEHRNEIFYKKFLLGRVDKFWWKHLSSSDKDSVIRCHNMQDDYFSMPKKDRSNHWYSYEVFDTWSEWFEHINKTFEPNKVSLREDKLKVIGI